MTQFPDLGAPNYDLVMPLQDILRGLSVLPNANETAEGLGVAFGGTPQSVSIIEAGGTALSKGWTVVAGLVGGVGAIGAGIGTFWTSISDPLRLRIVLASGIVISTAMIAIAIIVSVDVYSRSRAAIAQYQARTQLGSLWLRLAHEKEPAVVAAGAAGAGAQAQKGGAKPNAGALSAATVLAALAAGGKQAAVSNHGEIGHLGGVRLGADGKLLLRFIGADANQNDWLDSGDIGTFEFTYP